MMNFKQRLQAVIDSGDNTFEYDDVRRLLKENERLCKDAERYRWLRANARRIDFAGLSWTQGCELDARIDAALAAGEKP